MCVIGNEERDRCAMQLSECLNLPQDAYWRRMCVFLAGNEQLIVAKRFLCSICAVSELSRVKLDFRALWLNVVCDCLRE